MTEKEQIDRDLNRVQTRSCEERRKEPQKQWRLHPIEQYEEEIYDRLIESDASERMRVVRKFESYLLKEVAPESDVSINGVRDAVERDIKAFLDDVLIADASLSWRTIRHQLQILSSFYSTLDKQKAYAGNPVRRPLSSFRHEYEGEFESGRPYIPFDRLQKFLSWLDTAFSRVLWLLAFKEGLRRGEAINIDLRCLHLDHPIFWEVADNHDVVLDERVRDRPDTIFIYGAFNAGTEVPNDNVPGWKESGEVRKCGNKRKQTSGSVLPVDSELKTALIEWLLVRPATYDLNVHPLFAIGISNLRRIGMQTVRQRLWEGDSHIDSIRRWSKQESLSDCPTCNSDRLVEQNLADAEKTGRRFRCQNCSAVHWRSIHWKSGLEVSQKMVYHQGRHTFSSAHDPGSSDLHNDAIPDAVRKQAIRGDSNQHGDTEDKIYIEDQYKNFDQDIRQPYLNGIYKFGVYENPIMAVGEGWEG
jgi:integrase